MDDEHGAQDAGRRIGAVLVALVVAGAGEARAQGFTGSLQVQYQRYEQNPLVLVDGEARRVRTVQEYWLQTYEVYHRARIRQSLSLLSQLQWNEVRRPGSAERSRTPYGALRLNHPWFGVSGSYRPISATSPLSAAISGFADSATAQTTPGSVTSRNQETRFSGHFSIPRLPRVDASWTRRHRDRNLLFREEAGISRVVSSSYELGATYVRGSYSDLAREAEGTGPPSILQRNVAAGAGTRFHLGHRVGTSLTYDFGQSRREGVDGPGFVTRSHSASLQSRYQQSPRATWTVAYNFRRAETPGRAVVGQNNHEGAASYSLQASRAVRFSTGVGARTERTEDRTELLRYANATLSAEGNARRHLRAVGSLAHITNWLPSGRRFSVNVGHGGLRARLRQGLELTEDFDISANSDSASRDSRFVTQNTLGLKATPLRSFAFSVTDRVYHAGPGPFRSNSYSRTTALDVRWTVVPALQVTANAQQSGLLPRNQPKSSSLGLGIRWSPSSRFQLSGDYTRTGSTIRNPEVGPLPGREFLTGRLLAGLGRTTTLSVGTSVVDPGKASRSRQYDVLVSKGFRR